MFPNCQYLPGPFLWPGPLGVPHEEVFWTDCQAPQGQTGVEGGGAAPTAAFITCHVDNKFISEDAIYKFRYNLMYATLKESSDKPYGTRVERLFALF